MLAHETASVSQPAKTKFNAKLHDEVLVPKIAR
jgi:hypothetical protein